MRKYWNEELWNADYRDAFTKQEVKRYSLGEMEQFTEDVGGEEEHWKRRRYDKFVLVLAYPSHSLTLRLFLAC